ncbi:DUF3352 domain-containing protein [Sphaerisporangium sp. NPDC049002]|uniref:DUF3352 domain-containing protein n=1 Tax=Sphaerisporangium sp. NPDC049002 TaxID=3155392 RepID=UPI0033FAB99F
MSGQPLPPYPFNQDPDRTVSYRHPVPDQGPGPYTQPYAQPSGPPPWRQEELGPPVPSARKTGRGWLFAIIAAVLVVVVGGGGVYAVTLLSGGGTQPEDVLPSGTLAYVRVDLDPAANQKVALFTLARKFSATRDSFTGDDPRKALFDLLGKNSEDLAKVDYARDVEPWIGSRLGFGLLAPQSGKRTPQVAVAVQVTDEAGARTGLAKLNAGGELKGLAFREDYAILAETQAAADSYVTAAPLSQNADFAADLKAVGEPGVLSFWGNVGEIAKAAGAAMPTDTATLDMIKNVRLAGALRFDSGYAELTGISRGSAVQGPADPGGIRLSTLPASTSGALSVSGLGDTLAKQWPQIMKAAEGPAGSQAFTDFVTQAQQMYGIALPADLVTLLGKNLTVAVDAQGLDGAVPNVGAVLTTDPAKAQEVVSKIERFLTDSGAGAPRIAKAAGDGKLVLASSQDYAGKLNEQGTLGDSETFKIAIPDADAATAALFVDLDKIEKYYLDGFHGDDRANLQALRAVGLSGRQSGDTTSFSLRVLFN